MSRIKITGYKGLTKAMASLVRNIVEDMIPEIEERAKEGIDEVIYNTHTPENYNRMEDDGGLRGSLRAEVYVSPTGTNVGVTLRHDLKSIISNPEDFQHGSVIDGETTKIHNLPELIEEGGSGPHFGDGYWMAPRPYTEEIRKKLKDDYWFSDELSKRLNK